MEGIPVIEQAVGCHVDTHGFRPCPEAGRPGFPQPASDPQARALARLLGPVHEDDRVAPGVQIVALIDVAALTVEAADVSLIPGFDVLGEIPDPMVGPQGIHHLRDRGPFLRVGRQRRPPCGALVVDAVRIGIESIGMHGKVHAEVRDVAIDVRPQVAVVGHVRDAQVIEGIAIELTNSTSSCRLRLRLCPRRRRGRRYGLGPAIWLSRQRPVSALYL